MSLESAYREKLTRDLIAERFPGFMDVTLDHFHSQIIAWAWNGLIGHRSFSDVELDDAYSLAAFFDEKLCELHSELSPEAL